MLRVLLVLFTALLAMASSAPPPADPTPVIAGQVPAVASGLNIPRLLGPKRVPPSAAPDVVGAFRFICGPGQVLFDDPIVYPGQPGRAHLHQFFGNLSADAHSTYASLRARGESTCMNELNRSAYWMPAMLDGRGNVVRPDYVSIYYKRRPKSDPLCTTRAKACVDLPRGLRFIFGWNQFRPNDPQPENEDKFNFKCMANGHPASPVFPTMGDALKNCHVGQQLMAGIHTPICWDGVHLDSPDHRSHLSDAVQSHCPRTHPMWLPQFTLGASWTIQPGDEPAKWTLSSDHMRPGGVPGSTFHADWYGAWEDNILERWEAGCVEHLLNCSDGDLGDGQIMTRGRYYPAHDASPHLVPIPRH